MSPCSTEERSDGGPAREAGRPSEEAAVPGIRRNPQPHGAVGFAPACRQPDPTWLWHLPDFVSSPAGARVRGPSPFTSHILRSSEASSTAMPDGPVWAAGVASASTICTSVAGMRMASRRPSAKSSYVCSTSRLPHLYREPAPSPTYRAEPTRWMRYSPFCCERISAYLSSPPRLGQHGDLVDPRVLAEELFAVHCEAVPTTNRRWAARTDLQDRRRNSKEGGGWPSPCSRIHDFNTRLRQVNCLASRPQTLRISNSWDKTPCFNKRVFTREFEFVLPGFIENTVLINAWTYLTSRVCV